MFVSWIRYHGRSAGLAAELGVPAAFVAVGRLGRRATAPLRYLVQGLRTVVLLARRRPTVLYVMAPPVPLVLIGLAYQAVTQRPLVVDAHTGAVLGPGARPRRTFLRLARRARVTIVTTEHLGRVLLDAGVRAVVVHDPPFGEPAPPPAERPRPLFVMPCSWYHDEPLDALRLGAVATPEVDIVLTGRPAGPLRDQSSWPANVRLAGWLDDRAYRDLLCSATGLLALTTREMTMQRAGYEALILGRPAVVSDTAVLREYFRAGALCCRPEAGDIGRALRECAARAPVLGEQMARLRAEKQDEFRAALASVQRAVAPPDQSVSG